MKKNLISIIVPIYNVEKYLNKCVDSIINQTYKNIEIILIDDGSPDNCGKICDEYAKKDSRIQVIHKENGGLSDARNAGLNIASGEYIGFIDSDDYIAPNMYEKLHNKIVSDKSDMAVCALSHTDENGNPVRKTLNKNYYVNQLYNAEQFITQLRHCVTAVNKLYKSALWDNIRFPIGKIHEDEFVFHKITEKCSYISYIMDELYFYIQHDNSITTKPFNIKRLDAVEAYMDRVDCTLRNGWLKAAELAMIDAISLFFIARKKLDLTFPENRKKMSEFKRALNEAYAKLISHKISPKNKILYGIFIINPQLYQIIVFILGTLKRSLLKLRNYTFLKKLLRKLLLPIKIVVRKFRSIKFGKKLNMQLENIRNHSGFCVIILATPCHGNLGDHAIVYSEKKLLSNFYLKNQIVEISNEDYLKHKNTIKKYIAKNDVIIIDGGGNLGTLWPHEDDKIREIIKTYKNNKIVVFPQTAYYDESSDGQKRINKNKKIYEKATNLTITLRDKQSYDFCKSNFQNTNVEFVPDIVLSIEKNSTQNRADKCLLCFRQDPEKIVTEEAFTKLSEFLSAHGIAHENFSTIYHKNVSMYDRDEVLENMWTKISGNKLMITDRLHGMIFAAITGTPCLALDNKSKKVSGVYEWISHLEYIKVCNSMEELISYIPNFSKISNIHYNATPIKEKLNNLLERVIQDVN